MAGTLVPPTEQGHALTAEDIAAFQKAFEAEPRYRQSMNAVCTTPIGKVALNRRRAAKVDHTYSHHLTENAATHQKQSGRCWLFAALNTFRTPCIQKMNLDEKFELSQNYVLFWDKLEKANYFLENILRTL